MGVLKRHPPDACNEWVTCVLPVAGAAPTAGGRNGCAGRCLSKKWRNCSGRRLRVRSATTTVSSYCPTTRDEVVWACSSAHESLPWDPALMLGAFWWCTRWCTHPSLIEHARKMIVEHVACHFLIDAPCVDTSPKRRKPGSRTSGGNISRSTPWCSTRYNVRRRHHTVRTRSLTRSSQGSSSERTPSRCIGTAPRYGPRSDLSR
jgi:hypothetical protein